MKFWDLKKQDERNELYLYGEIAGTKDWGDEFTPQDLKEALDGLNGAELSIYINSGGGEVFAGQAIYTMLKRYAGRKTVYVDGIAASIASVIAMAGDRVIMPENAMMMIHKAWTLAIGNADDLAKMAAEMTKLDGVIAGVYAAKTGRDAGDILGAMAEETWFTATEALEYGLCDEIEAGKAVAASMNENMLTVNGQTVDVSRYAHADKVRAMVPAEEPAEEPDNGAETQPVEDIKDALEEQRRHFDALRRKIIITT